MGRLLEVKNLNVSYNTYAGEVKSVRGIDFSIDEGEILAIVGESGCGKSVTAKSIMGLIDDSNGVIKKGSKILYKDKNILEFTEKEWNEHRGAECSIIFQDALASLNPTMTIGKQIAENLVIHKGMNKDDAIKESIKMLEKVGISNPERRVKQYPHEFSGGMSQRVMIASALSCEPKLLIADEPTTALDVTIQAQIMKLIRDLQKDNSMSVILITHDLGVVADVATNIIVMYSGKIVERGSSRDIFYNPKHPYTWALLNAVPRLDLKNNKKLATIDGMPPNLINPPKGCPFSTRCEFCMNICIDMIPPEYKIENEHMASCWLHHPQATIENIPFESGGIALCQN